MAEFIKQHGFAAQARCQTSFSYSSGELIEEIRQHLYSKFPEIKAHKISHATIWHLFEAPNQSNCASIRYKRLIQARVGTKTNCYREPNVDVHYLFAHKKMRQEMITLFNNLVKIISIDNMVEVKVGPPAVSRYHQIKRSLPKNNGINFPD